MDGDDQTARELWVAIEASSAPTRSRAPPLLSHAFHSMQQGDTPIFDFCQEMKKMADSLSDIGHGVSDSQLVLNLLRGLNDCFTNTADDIANSTVLPTFAQARDILVLKELRLKNSDSVAASTALLASTNASSTCTSPGCRSSSAGSAPARGDQRRGGGGNGARRRRKRRRRRQAWQGQRRQQAGGTPQPMGQ